MTLEYHPSWCLWSFDELSTTIFDDISCTIPTTLSDASLSFNLEVAELSIKETNIALVGTQKDIYICSNLNDTLSSNIDPLKVSITWVNVCSTASLTAPIVSDQVMTFNTLKSLTVDVPSDSLGLLAANPADLCGARTL